MTTLLSPALHSIPAGYIEAVCIGCNAAIEIPAGSALPRCTACQRSDAEAEARKLLADARDLRDGKGIWSGLTADERREQIRALVFSTDDQKPATQPLDQSLADLVGVLSDASVDALADIVARRISQRKGKPVAGRTPTLVRVAIADLSDVALIDLVGASADPIILNAASAELSRRLSNVSDSYSLPIYSKPDGADPTPAQRDAIESTIESTIEAGSRFVPADDEDPRAGSWDSDFAA